MLRGDLHSSFADAGVVACFEQVSPLVQSTNEAGEFSTVTEAQDLIVDPCGLARIMHLLIRGRNLGVSDVVHNGVVEKHRALRNNPYSVPKALACNVSSERH